MAILADSESVDKKHPQYGKNIEKWNLWYAAYEGDEDFIDLTIKKHERESNDNFELRKDEAEVFNYSETIINTYAGFIGMANPDENIGSLAQDPAFQRFQNDTDLRGTDYSIFWNNATALAGVFGFCGILVDRPPGAEGTQRSKADDERDGVHAYYAVYVPTNIWDWTWEKNPVTGREELTYLKLKESSTSILVMNRERWERWVKEDADDTEWTPGESGENKTKRITFVWYVNYQIPTKPYLGLSDIRSIARLQAALTRDLSHGNEVIKYAAFPMMIKPMLPMNQEPSEEDDVSGVTAVVEFDPEHPESKPSWLEAAVAEPIDAVIKWDEQKEEEIYRTAGLSAFYGTHSEARSGVALRAELTQLAAILMAKSKARDDAETQALRYWRLREGMPVDNSLRINRPLTINLDELRIVLENLLLAKSSVRSETFKRELEKKVARQVLTNVDKKILGAIENEIDTTESPSKAIEREIDEAGNQPPDNEED